ncbi:hypothetical protein O0L34_g1505 [Tuta absoluta]|nr:hypothetical protein O0L34_g1505 [Tuta absoluta]
MCGPLLVSAILFLTPITAHYLSDSVVSGEAPVNYCRVGEDGGEQSLCKNDLPLYVNRLNTEKSFIPFEYHDFDFCISDETQSPALSLGQVLLGDRIRPSPYKVNFLENVDCKTVCTKAYRAADPEAHKRLNFLKKGIALSYQHNWILDSIPVSWCYHVEEGGKSFCSAGFPMGCLNSEDWDFLTYCDTLVNVLPWKFGAHYLFNHVDLEITYHSGGEEEWGADFGENGGRIISVKVKPASIAHDPLNPHCSNRSPLEIPSYLSEDDVFTITYTYSVKFIKDNTIKWSSRWDNILHSMPQANIDVFPIMTYLMVALFLSGALAVILLWTLRRKIMTKTANICIINNQVEKEKEAQEMFGWKSLYSDVFRPPRCGMMLAVFLGSGSQVLGIALVTLAFACLGSYSPINRGGTLMTCAIVVWVFTGLLAGYVSARIYKSFGGEKQRTTILLTSMLWPGVVFSLFLTINLTMWYMASSAAVSNLMLLSLFGLWLGLTMPLTFLGAYIGFEDQVIEYPVKPNEIPRMISEQTICTTSLTHPITSIVLGGILPFASISVQLFLVFNSMWSNQMYWMYSFMFELLFLVFVILVITCSETTILLCYFHLCAEDYHLWWRAFLSAGSTAGYFFVYCYYYFITYLNIADGASTFIYFGCTIILTLLCFLLTGTIGFMACFWFVRKVYSVEPSK